MLRMFGFPLSRREPNVKHPGNLWKHGLSRHPLYHARTNMMYRCDSEKDPNCKPWAGKGVKVCKEWREDFNAFFTWAMSSGWKPGLQIDRINPSGNYEPTNCQWLTPSEHAKKTYAEQAA